MPGCVLREIPEDVRDYILDKQVKLRKKKGTMVSLETTIYAIIRDHKRNTEK